MQRTARSAALALAASLAAAGAVTALTLERAVAAPDGKPVAPAAGGAALTPVEKFFHGKILKLDGAKIEIAYDFSDPVQLKDFEASIPFRAIKTVAFELKNGKLAFSGTGSMRHRAVFDGDSGAQATFSPRRPRDFGFAVSEERESEVFTLYCCYDRYFSAGDNVYIPQNMIIKFIPRDPKVNKDGLQDWRYCGSRGQKPEVVTGKSYKVSMQRTGLESSMAIDDWDSKGQEAGRDLTAQHVAIYGYDTQVEVDDLIVRGKLDAAFVTKNGVDLTTWKPPVVAPDAKPGDPAGPKAATTAPSDAVTDRTRAAIAGYPLDTKPQALSALLRDAALPAGLRGEAAEKAKSVGSKRIVPFLVDGLYSEDLDARKLSFDVMKTLVGKSFNYRPDGPEDGRKKAIRDLNEYLQKHPEEFL